MKKVESIAGIDIGSSSVRVVVGQKSETGSVQIMGVGESPSRGISKGVIVDIEEIVTSLSEALENAERMVGFPLSSAVVGVSGPHCRLIESQGVVAVSKPNGEVQQTDVDRADEQSQTLAASPNYDILHVLPKYYSVDSQTHIKDPVGMTGIKLEARTQIISALSSQIKHLYKCMHRTQLEVEGLVFSPLATAQVVLTKRQKDLGVVMVNIGAWTTSIAVYEEGDLVHAAVLPIGSDHITGDLAIGLRVSLEIAERVKIDQGLVSSEKLSKRDEIDLAKYSSDDMPRSLFSRKNIAEIVEARCEEIFKMVSSELKKVGKDGKLPAGAVLTGGGAKLIGIIDYVKDTLRLPVFLGTTENIFTPIDRIKDPQFTTALGLVYFNALEERAPSSAVPGTSWIGSAFGGVFKRIRDITS